LGPNQEAELLGRADQNDADADVPQYYELKELQVKGYGLRVSNRNPRAVAQIGQYLIVGLGNPGMNMQSCHNIGYDVVNHFAMETWGGILKRASAYAAGSEWKGEIFVCVPTTL